MMGGTSGDMMPWHGSYDGLHPGDKWECLADMMGKPGDMMGMPGMDPMIRHALRHDGNAWRHDGRYAWDDGR